MEPRKNRKLLILCLCLAAIMIVVKTVLVPAGFLNDHVQQIAKWQWLLMSIVIIGLLLPPIQDRWYKKLMQLIKDDPDRFMEQTGKMLNNPFWRRFYDNIHENRAVTYALVKKDYQRAMDEMKLVDTNHLPSPESQGIHWGNLTELIFNAGNEEEACRIYETHQTSIEALDRLSPGTYDILLLPLKIRYAIAKGDPQAQDLLDRTRTAWELDGDKQDGLRELDELQQILSRQRD